MAPAPWAPRKVFAKPHRRARGNPLQDIALAPLIFSVARLLEREELFQGAICSFARINPDDPGMRLFFFVFSPCLELCYEGSNIEALRSWRSVSSNENLFFFKKRIIFTGPVFFFPPLRDDDDDKYTQTSYRQGRKLAGQIMVVYMCLAFGMKEML